MIKVNDELMKFSRWNGMTKVKVKSVTKTGRINLSDGVVLNENLSIRGASVWDTDHYKKIDDKIKKQYELQELRKKLEDKIKSLDIWEMDKEELKRIINIL